MGSLGRNALLGLGYGGYTRSRPGTQLTRARCLYVLNASQNFHFSTRGDGAHGMCRLPPPKSESTEPSPCYAFPVHRSPFLVPHSRPGTQCYTSATSLRKQLSKLRESDPKHGAAHKDVRCCHCAKDGAFGRNPAPRDRSLNGKFALRRKYRALCKTSPPHV